MASFTLPAFGQSALPRGVCCVLLLLLPLSFLSCDRKDERELPETRVVDEAPAEGAAVRETDYIPGDADRADALVTVAPPEIVPSERAPGLPAAGEEPAAGPAADDFQGYEAWFERYGLDLNDPGMLDADPDGDGYSNRDEFLVDTDPTDKESHPGFHPSMRMRQFTAVEIPLMLESVKGRQASMANLDTGETVKVSEGDAIPGTDYRVTRVIHQVESDKFGDTTDVSRLTAEDTRTGELVNFMRGMSPRSPGTHAVLTSLRDPDVAVEVRQGKEFVWPGGGEEQRFLVVDLRPEQVVVKQLDTGEVWTVPTERPKP